MDKYDREIAELLAAEHFYEEVQEHWDAATPLFACVTPKNMSHVLDHSETDDDGNVFYCGCLTQIRRGDHVASRDGVRAELALTEAIRADSRIPTDELNIEPEHLQVFAEWQRRLDKELGR